MTIEAEQLVDCIRIIQYDYEPSNAARKANIYQTYTPRQVFIREWHKPKYDGSIPVPRNWVIL